MNVEIQSPCPECGGGLAQIEPEKMVYCPHCGWKQPEKDQRVVITFSELTLRVATTPGVKRSGESIWKFDAPVVDDPDRDWGPLSLAIANNIDLSGVLAFGAAVVQGITSLAGAMTPVMRDIQVRMAEIEKELAAAKWRDALAAENEAIAEELVPVTSAVEFLEQKRQQEAERQAEGRRGRIKPWDNPGKRFR